MATRQSVPTAATAPAAKTEAAPAAAPRVPGAVGNAEHYSAPLPPTQEAAVLYACDHSEAAIQLLRLVLRDPVGKNNSQAWLMLLELYQLTNNKKEFDQLSMLFTVKFETSAPAWRDVNVLDDPRRTQKRPVNDFFAIKGSGGSLAGEIQKYKEFGEKNGSCRLDLTKIQGMTADEAMALAQAIRVLRRGKKALWFNGLTELSATLQKQLRSAASAIPKGYWELLFESLIFEGKQKEFEELGLEYAVAHEESPPNWEPYVNPQAPAERPEGESTAKLRAIGENVYFVRGALSAAAKNVIPEMVQFAQSRSEVVIDMGGCIRVDFTMMDGLFDAVKSLQLGGKRVIMTHVSELAYALLEAFGVNRHAILVRKKPL